MATVRYSYAGGGRLASEQRSGAFNTYQIDAQGSTSRIVSSAGADTDDFAFTGNGILASRSGTTPTPMQWLATRGVFTPQTSAAPDFGSQTSGGDPYDPTSGPVFSMPDKFRLTFPVFGLPELNGLLDRLSSDYEDCFFCGGLFSGTYPHGNGPVPPPRAPTPPPPLRDPPHVPPTPAPPKKRKPPFSDLGAGRWINVLKLLTDFLLCGFNVLNPTGVDVTREPGIKGVNPLCPGTVHKGEEGIEWWNGPLSEGTEPIKELGSPLAEGLGKGVKPLEFATCIHKAIQEFQEAQDDQDDQDEGGGDIAPWRNCSNPADGVSCDQCCQDALGVKDSHALTMCQVQCNPIDLD